jgi:hypothetical protein
MRTKQSGTEGNKTEWEALSKEVASYAEEVDDASADCDESSSESGDDVKAPAENVDADVDTEFDADRQDRDAAIVDEFEDIDKVKIDILDGNIDLPPLSMEDRKEACVLLSKVSFYFIVILIYIHLF